MLYSLLDLMVWGRKSRTYQRWIYGKMDRCWICESVFGPKAVGSGVRQLQMFKGYTVDFLLRQFRSLLRETEPEFIDFDSPKGIKLCSAMHKEAIKQLNKQFGREVFISI